MSPEGTTPVPEFDMDTIRADAMDAAGMGLYRCTTDGTVLSMDRAALRVFDLQGQNSTPADVEGKNIASVVDFNEAPSRILEDARDRGSVRGVPTRFRTRTGEERRVMLDAYALRDRNGNPVIQLVVRPIAENTDHAERNRAAEALGRSERRYRELYESLRDGSATVDMEGRFVAWNSAFQAMLGYTDEELRELTYTTVTPGHWHSVEAQIIKKQVLKQGYSQVYEKELIRKDGTVFPVELRTYLVRGEDGQPAGMWAIIRDITARVEAEEKHQRLEDQLQQAQKMEAIGRLAAGVAHDFNNILTAIIGYAELARSRMNSGRGVLEAIDGIEQAAQQAGGVTQSLLTFSRKSAARKSPLNLGQAVSEALAMLRRLLPASIALEENVETSDDVWVDGDAAHLHQVVMNLVLNARDAMPRGGVLRVTVRHQPAESSDVLDAIATRGHGTAELEVEDSGPGMPADVVARIFEPFYTTKPRQRGTGLGLAVVHGIVAEHDGRISVDSQEGRGTRVTVTFPAREPPGAVAPEGSVETVEPGQGELFLVVEDDPQVLAIVTSALRGAGYRVVQATDGAEGVTAFKEHRDELRLVILDVVLPKKSGLACLRQIRKMRPDLPAIVISGSVAPGVEEQSAPGTRLLRKPFKPSELGKLASVLLHAQEREKAASE